MNIVAINGSPKPKQSLTEQIVEWFGRRLGEPVATYQATRLVQGETPAEALDEMLSADVLLVALPLYVDGLPASLIELLARLEQAAREHAHRPRVYAIVNCGFYHAEQTKPALHMMRHFAERTGCAWGAGLGIGGGPMLSSMGDWTKGLAAPVGKALGALARAAQTGVPAQDAFVCPTFTRWLYATTANIGWRSMARGHGVRSELRARPYA